MGVIGSTQLIVKSGGKQATRLEKTLVEGIIERNKKNTLTEQLKAVMWPIYLFPAK